MTLNLTHCFMKKDIVTSNFYIHVVGWFCNIKPMPNAIYCNINMTLNLFFICCLLLTYKCQSLLMWVRRRMTYLFAWCLNYVRFDNFTQFSQAQYAASVSLYSFDSQTKCQIDSKCYINTNIVVYKNHKKCVYNFFQTLRQWTLWDR